MKNLKDFAIRMSALAIFFAMIASIILYQAGFYEISFIKRPTPDFPVDSESVSEDLGGDEGPGTDGGDDTTDKGTESESGSETTAEATDSTADSTSAA